MRWVVIVGVLLAMVALGCDKDAKPTTPTPSASDPKPDFHLQDVNPNSSSSGQSVSPRDYLGKVSAWYFGHATWGYCGSQFGFLDLIQFSFGQNPTRVAVQILGVNEAGEEADNAVMTSGRSIPWLQDTSQQHVWNSWRVTFRDVVVLDPSNRVVAVFNLTEHDLQYPAERDSLVQILRRAAQ
jgi:hypothetical protein